MPARPSIDTRRCHAAVRLARSDGGKSGCRAYGSTEPLCDESFPDRSCGADADYLAIGGDVTDGSVVENVVVERPGRGGIVLDFDPDGRLLGVEIIVATRLLHDGP